MSEKKVGDTDTIAQGGNKSLSMEMQSMKKKQSVVDEKSEKLNDDNSNSDFVEHRMSSDEEDEFAFLDSSLAKLPAIEKFKKMREKTSHYGSSGWYDRLFFGWVFKIIEMA